ncbi:MAG TPA: hypothetical protein VGC85_04080 [Chthoniobacterales bacterium]
MSFIRTGFRELGLKVRRQRTRMALRHEKRLLQRAHIALGREGVNQAGTFPELRTEIVALKKLEQEQREVTLRIAQAEESLKKIEAQRERNGQELATAVAALEEEKKPILQRRNEAKSQADVCDRELSGVERRLQENDTVDRELLEKISALQAQVPPPADLETQSASIAARRAQLPEQRAEIVRARLGAADACRMAKESLAAHQAQLDAVDKRIAAVRAEYEAKDRALNENARAQQDALKEARAQHQTVEERKNPAYLNIGRHLATQNIAPQNAPHLLETVHRHRGNVDRHTAHKAELAIFSSEIDKQELRKFYFSLASVVVLLAIILPLVFQSPGKREWLPQETEAILSLNTVQLERDDLAKRWEKDRADEWQTIWSGLTTNAQRTPGFNLARDSSRITRGLATTANGSVREFVLVQAKSDVSPIVRTVGDDHTFQRDSLSGLPIWRQEDFALARVGPRTIAVGTPTEVEELVQVRLGIREDLKISGTLLDRFQALDQESTLRLISSNPPSLGRYFAPIFSRELLEATQIIGVGLSLGNPLKARVVLKMKSPKAASDLAQRVRSEPQRWLKIQDSDALLFAEAPEVTTQQESVEIRCNVPENTARLLLQRVAKSNAGPAVAAQ